MIVPANTFIATAEAVVNVGATPVFVDIDPSTFLITASRVEAAITPRTAAVIAVHLYGLPADMDAIRQVASAAGIAVLEDAAQAHGARWGGRPVGSLSDAGCFSFYPSKNPAPWATAAPSSRRTAPWPSECAVSATMGGRRRRAIATRSAGGTRASTESRRRFFVQAEAT